MAGTAIIICGSPGSGKSTYARRLMTEKTALLLDIDTVTERLVRAALKAVGHNADDRDSPYFKATFRAPIYETLFDIAKENLDFRDVIVVGPFTAELKDPNWPNTLRDRLGSRIEVHYVYCELEERKRRIRARNNPRDLQKLENWNAYLSSSGPEMPPVFDHVSIDTN